MRLGFVCCLFNFPRSLNIHLTNVIASVALDEESSARQRLSSYRTKSTFSEWAINCLQLEDGEKAIQIVVNHWHVAQSQWVYQKGCFIIWFQRTGYHRGHWRHPWKGILDRSTLRVVGVISLNLEYRGTLQTGPEWMRSLLTRLSLVQSSLLTKLRRQRQWNHSGHFSL